nr:MAG TPA: hypothetical protein [Bacteriophage sp.]
MRQQRKFTNVDMISEKDEKSLLVVRLVAPLVCL